MLWNISEKNGKKLKTPKSTRTQYLFLRFVIKKNLNMYLDKL